MARVRCRTVRPGRRRRVAAVAVPTATVAAVVAVILTATAAVAAPGPSDPAATAPELAAVLDRIRVWLMAILGSYAVLCFTIGFFRYLGADGDVGETERAKRSFRAAAVGIAGALLAPLLVRIITDVVGG